MKRISKKILRVEGDIMNLLIEYITVNGKEYKLQHPGNREVIKLRTRCVNAQTGATDLEKLMDFSFEHVVIPHGHAFKPTVDNIHPKEFEEWLEIIPGFLRHGGVGRYKMAEDGIEKGGKESAS